MTPEEESMKTKNTKRGGRAPASGLLLVAALAATSTSAPAPVPARPAMRGRMAQHAPAICAWR